REELLAHARILNEALEGGTVRYITTQPSLTKTSIYSRAEFSSTQGGDPSYEAGVAAGGPLVQEKFGARLSVWYRKDGGWIDRIDPVTLDFSGTDPQARGNVNAVRAVTESAVAFALRAVLDPTLPANAGAMRNVRVVTEPGAIVDALPPAAVGAGNVEVSQRVADVCLGALAQALPERVGAASQGTMNNL
ncbi:hypothetical protein B4Q13_22290, partial [Lacticaseibacillus rhamnosus]